MKQSPFHYESWAVSHEGRVRDLNEDRFLDGPPSRPLGGRRRHGRLRRRARLRAPGIVEQLKTIGVSTSASDQHARFVDRLTQANNELQDYSQRNGGSILGSTVVALLIYEGEYRCLWVGDSRIYLIRQRQARSDQPRPLRGSGARRTGHPEPGRGAHLAAAATSSPARSASIPRSTSRRPTARWRSATPSSSAATG